MFWLTQRMTAWADRTAVAGERESATYGELLRRTDEWARRLCSDRWLRQARIVAIEGDYGVDACALLLALIDTQRVAVPIASATPAERKRYLEIATVDAVIRIPAAEGSAVQVFPWSPAGPRSPLLAGLLERKRPGLILFSSGSTGEPKAALHDFPRLLERFENPGRTYRTCSFLLFDHIGGLNTLFYTLANGGVLGVPAGRDPDAVCAAIERHRLELLPTSPTFLNLLLLSEAYRRYDLSSLRLITYGTEVMPETTLRRLREALPGVRLRQTYGLSEVGILRSRSRSDDSVWVKVGGEGYETKIVDGTLWVRARSAMLGYLNAPSPFDADGWLDTGDLVEADGEYIRFLGRRNELINVGGQKVFPAEVETVLLEIPEVADATVYGENNPIFGQIVAAAVRPARVVEPAEFRRRIRTWCGKRLPAYKVPTRIRIVERTGVGVRMKKSRRLP